MSLTIKGLMPLDHPPVTPSKIEAVEPLTESKESKNEMVSKKERGTPEDLKRPIKKIDPKKLLDII